MPVTFIGDVHGWLDRLDRVLDQAEGELVFMGDLIDRGPDAIGVIDRVRGLCDAGRARCLLGNHEYALVRGLGHEALGIPADEALYRSWCVNFGGWAVMDALGMPDTDPLRLHRLLGDRFDWLAGLPWLLEGDAEGQPWYAVHAGLDGRSWHDQHMLLGRGWAADDGWPAWLFDKQNILEVPRDFPAEACLVSGHTPRLDPLVTRGRILCDTSGGRPGRLLSGVIWPAGRVITG